MINDEKCNCGKPVRYLMQDGSGSCNKRAKCPTYDKLHSRVDMLISINNELHSRVDMLISINNELESKCKDLKKVVKIILED